MDEEYRKLIEQIKQAEDDYADEKMKPVYSEQKKALDALEVIIGGLFIKYAIDGLLKMNAQQKSNVGINNTLKNIGKSLGKAEIEVAADILGKTYVDTYYKNAFIMDSGFKIDLKFDILKKEFIDAAVNQKFKGELFSDRIWKNKADMIDKLQSSITEAMKGKTTIDKVARDIKNTFNVQAYESQRLVQTENARVQTQASYDIGISSGVEQVLFSSTLDNKTSDFCQEHDGEIYDINDNSKPEIPAHPNCRSCWINIPYEGWQATSRKDNSTKEVIDYVNYKEWAKEKGID